MQNIPLASLKEDLRFTEDLMLDNTFLLLPSNCPVSKELIVALNEWKFDKFYTEGSVSLDGAMEAGSDSVDDNGEKVKNKIGASVKEALEDSRNSQLDGSDKSRMAMVQRVYDEYTNYIEGVFTHYATHKEIDQEEISETVKELCGFIKNNQRYILRINPSFENNGKNFLVIHTIRSTVLAIAIAMYMRMPFSKISEVGITCILHEIGMLRLPPQLYITNKPLTPGERIQIYKHPLFGYAIVKDLDFPMNVQLGVLEHHEKENGTGYPRKMTGDKISTIAKIISVACSYEAITSPRSYKEERSNFDAILELLRNTNHPYDDAVIKALFYTVSLYPIGSYVYLTNRKAAVVIDTNPENPKLPVVQLLTEFDSKGAPVIVETGKSDIKILRILTRREQEDILKLLAEKEKSATEASVKTKVAAPEKTSVEETNSASSPKKGMEEIDITLFS